MGIENGRRAARVVSGVAVVLAAVLVGASLVLVAPAAQAAAVLRISGSDRYETSALQVAQFASASTVWIASGADFPDALAAGPAAAAQGGPLLLTAPGSLPAAAKSQLSRLKPAKIVIAGGLASVSAGVATALQAFTASRSASSVVRVSGADRYATSRAIADYAFGRTPTAYAVAGTDWPDALSAGAAAAHVIGPLLLVNGGASAVDSATSATLSKHGVTQLRVAGGTAVINVALQNSLAGRVSSVVRVSGADRYATSVAVNQGAFTPTATQAVLASGANFPDALSGVALAGHLGAPLYLVQPTCLPSTESGDLLRLGNTNRIILGGTAAVSSAVDRGTVCPDFYTNYGTFSSQTKSGSGDGVVALPGVKGGWFTASFTGTNGASSWFTVTAQDSDSVATDAALSSFGQSFAGSSGWGLAQPATGKAATSLQVRATGSWTITLHQMADLPALSASGTGYAIARYDGGAGPWRITGSTSAASRLFDVRQYTVSPRFTVLASTSAVTYTGTVNHLAGPSIIQVLGTSAWTIR